MTFEDWVKQRYGDNMPVSIDVKAAFTAGMKTGWEQAKGDSIKSVEAMYFRSEDILCGDTIDQATSAIASMEYKGVEK